MTPLPPLTAAILTVSDRCAAGLADDASGPALADALAAWRADVEIAARGIVPDDEAAIRATLLGWADARQIALILTTGGTGFAPRDRTPEAVAPLIERPAPGLVVAMIQHGLATTPFAMLSRPVAGIRGRSLLVTLPGSPRGAVDSLSALLPALSHALALLRDEPDGRH